MTKKTIISVVVDCCIIWPAMFWLFTTGSIVPYTLFIVLSALTFFLFGFVVAGFSGQFGETKSQLVTSTGISTYGTITTFAEAILFAAFGYFFFAVSWIVSILTVFLSSCKMER